jgi:hypothetical protein
MQPPSRRLEHARPLKVMVREVMVRRFDDLNGSSRLSIFVVTRRKYRTILCAGYFRRVFAYDN